MIRLLSISKSIRNVVWVQILGGKVLNCLHQRENFLYVKTRNLVLSEIFRNFDWLLKTKSSKTWNLIFKQMHRYAWFKYKKIDLFNSFWNLFCNGYWHMILLDIPMINSHSLSFVLSVINRDEFDWIRLWK